MINSLDLQNSLSASEYSCSDLRNVLGKQTQLLHGPYRIVGLTTNDAHIRRVDRPAEEPILVLLERLRRCPEEIPDRFWPDGPPRKWGRPRKISDPKQTLENGSTERNHLQNYIIQQPQSLLVRMKLFSMNSMVTKQRLPMKI